MTTCDTIWDLMLQVTYNIIKPTGCLVQGVASRRTTEQDWWVMDAPSPPTPDCGRGHRLRSQPRHASCVEELQLDSELKGTSSSVIF